MKKDDIKSKIKAEEIIIGENVVIEDDVFITGKNGPAEQVIIGDNVFIGNSTKIIVPKLYLGDYTTIHNHTLAHGWEPLQIGRNFWLGQHSILDSIGGLDIDDFVTIGAMSHIWTHIRSGDPIQGCRFNSQKYLRINKDVWVAPSCHISAVKIGEKSMALLGSLIIHNMKPNHVYMGCPAVDITKKIGTQFKEITIEEKYEKMKQLINKFEMHHPEFKDELKVVRSTDDFIENKTCFNVSSRTYTKKMTKAETLFFRENSLVKFIPYNELQPFRFQKDDK